MAWEITNPQNAYLWASQGPYAWTSDYGYETQLNTFPSIMTPIQAQVAHGILNPNHISQWAPMFAFPMQSVTTDPMLLQRGLDAACSRAEYYFNQAGDNINFSKSTQMVNSVAGAVAQLTESEDLTDDQKAKLQPAIDKAEDLKKRLEKYQEDKQRTPNDPAVLSRELAAIREEAEALKGEFAEICEAIKAEVEAAKKKEKEDKSKVEDNPDAEKDEDKVEVEETPKADGNPDVDKKEDDKPEDKKTK